MYDKPRPPEGRDPSTCRTRSLQAPIRTVGKFTKLRPLELKMFNYHKLRAGVIKAPPSVSIALKAPPTLENGIPKGLRRSPAPFIPSLT